MHVLEASGGFTRGSSTLLIIKPQNSLHNLIGKLHVWSFQQGQREINLTILPILPIYLNKDGSTEHRDNLFLEITGDTVGDEPEGVPDC